MSCPVKVYPLQAYPWTGAIQGDGGQRNPTPNIEVLLLLLCALCILPHGSHKTTLREQPYFTDKEIMLRELAGLFQCQLC